MALLQVVVRLQARGDELRVVDQTILVGVDNIHGVKQLSLRQIDLIDLLHALFELLKGERAITVLVHLSERHAKGLNLVFWNTGGNQR